MTHTKVTAIKIPSNIYSIEQVGNPTRDTCFKDSIHTMADIIDHMVSLYKNSPLSELAASYEDTTTYRNNDQPVDTKARLKGHTASNLKAMSERTMMSQSNLTFMLLAMFFAEVE